MGKIMHGGQAYSGGGGTTVIANPSGTSSADLNKVSIEGVIYNIPSGGGGGGSVTDVKVDNVSVVGQNGVANIDTMTGAGSSSAGTKGLVPAPASGDNDKYLKGDGTWGTPSGGGGSSTLAGLSDVNISSVSDGQLLQYDAQSGKWKNVSVNDMVTVEQYDYVQFSASSTGASTAASRYIKLPYTVNADYKITVVFDIPTYYSNNSVIGNNNATKYTALNGYSNRWYAGNGTGESNFAGSMTGKHTFVNNDGNGNNLFDGSIATAYSPQTNTSAYLLIGGRYNGNNLRGKIYSYKIEKISNGDVVLDLIPAKVKFGPLELGAGLYDRLSGTIYTCEDLDFGNDS